MAEDAAFWRDQYDLAASVAADLAELNDHDGQVAKLRSLLARERDRREEAERENDRLVSVLMNANTDQCGCLGGLVNEWAKP